MTKYANCGLMMWKKVLMSLGQRKHSNGPLLFSTGNEQQFPSWVPSTIFLVPKSVLCVTLLSIIVICISLVLLTVDRVKENYDVPLRKIHFSVLFDRNVRKIFKNQRADSIRAMLHGVRAALCNHCERPPVLMFLATESAYTTAQLIAKRLIHAYLVAQGFDMKEKTLKKAILKGSKYQALDNYWDFFRGLSKRLAFLKVAIISEFHRLHPQVASILCHLADDAFSPYPKAVILLLVDMNNHFTKRELQTRSAIEMAESFTNHIMTGFLDWNAVTNLQTTICGRPVYIEAENHLELL